jgi:hypothetical protein
MVVRQLSRPIGATRLYAQVDGFRLRTHAISVVSRAYGDDLQAPLTALGILLDVRAREPLYEGGRLRGAKSRAPTSPCPRAVPVMRATLLSRRPEK